MNLISSRAIFKNKIITAVLALTLGFGATSAANATPSYASNPGSAVGQVSFSNNLTTTGSTATFPLPSGLTTLSLSSSYTVGTTSTTAARGTSMTVSALLQDPSNATVTSYASQGANVMFYNSAGSELVNGNTSVYLSGSTSVTVPSDATSITIYLNSSNTLVPNTGSSTFAAGTYTLTPTVSFNGTALPLSSTASGLTLFNGSATWSESATNFTNPSVAVSGEQVTLATCINTSLIHSGDTLTIRSILNGVVASNSYSSYFSDLGSINGGNYLGTQGSYTVSTNDITSGMYAATYLVLPTTANASITSDISVVDAGVEVSQSCMPTTPSAPSVSYTNGSLVTTIANPVTGTSYVCDYYDAANPSTIAYSFTTSNTGSPRTCMYPGTAGHTYTVTVIARLYLNSGQLTLNSAASPASTSAAIPFAGFTLTAPSGNSTAGALSVLSNQVTAPTGAVSYGSSPDGGDGLLYSAYVPTSNSGCSSNCDSLYSAKIGHLTASGADSTFASTGLATPAGTYDIPYGINFVGSLPAPAIGWFGNRDHWSAAVNASLVSPSSVTISSGADNSTSVSSVSLSVTTLNAFCAANFNVGVTVQSVAPVSMNSAVPVWKITCMASPGTITLANSTTNTSTYSAAVLATIPDASTITPIMTLGGLQTAVNAYSFLISVNPTAGANDAALTGVFVAGDWTTNTTESVVFRKIVRITPSLVVTQTTSTYSTQTTLSPNTSEPVLALAPNNNGTVYLTESTTASSTVKLATIGATGDIVAGQNVTFDSAANAALPFGGSSVSLKGAAQTGSSGNLYMLRTFPNPSAAKLALMKVNISTGQETTGEVASYVASTTSATAVLNSSYIASNGNAYWYYTSVASPSVFSEAKWASLDQSVVQSSDSSSTITINGVSHVSGDTINVAGGTSSVTVVATPTESHATVTVTGNSGFVTGNNALNVVVTAQDGSITINHFTVVMASSLSSDSSSTITINGVTHVSGDTINVGGNTSSLTVVATPTESHATATVIGNSGFVIGNNALLIIITAQDGSITTNHFTIVKSSSLSSDSSATFTVFGISIVNGDTYTVSSGVTSAPFVVTPTESHATSVITGASNLVSGNNNVTIVVTAQDGSTTTYHFGITVGIPSSNSAAAVSHLAISGLTAPVTGATPVTTITSDSQFSGTVTWSTSPSTFVDGVSYVATVTLTPGIGYTFTGVAANSFTAAGGTATNSANSGVVTVQFPAYVAPQQQQQQQNSTPSYVPDPVQKSKVMSMSPLTSTMGTTTTVVLTGNFVEKITNIRVNNVLLTYGCWKQTPTSVSFSMATPTAGTYSVQLFDGSVPVLVEQAFVVSVAKTASSTTSTVSASSTVNVSTEKTISPAASQTSAAASKPSTTNISTSKPTVRTTSKKIIALVCVKGKSSRTVRGVAPKCPVGFTKKK